MTGRFLGGITAVLIALGSAPGASADCMVAATDPSTIDGMFAAIPGFTVTPGCPAIGSPFAGTEMTAASAAAIGRDGNSVLTVFAGELASGSGAAMPQLAILDRGFKGKVYQTHAAATKDLMRVGGKAVEGTFVTSGPVVVAEQLPDAHPSKALGVKFNAEYEKINGAGLRNQFAAHSYDAYLMLDKVVPTALKKGKPGTPEFRAALKEALEATPALAVTHGVLDYSGTDHWGFRPDTGVVMKVVNGDWKLEH